jgi:hypothetical protein
MEKTMSYIILVGAFAAAMLTSDASNARQSDWAQARLACADVGIDPSSPAFNQCVFDLYYSLWDEQNESQR